jgi:hypothetical protein
MEAELGSALDRLKEQIRLQKTAEFPGEEWSDTDVEKAAKRLRQYDQMVSMRVIETIQGKPVEPEFKDDGPAILDELQRLLRIKPADLKKGIDRLIMYQERLAKMLELTNKVIAERGKP